jgi:hypothetical protein
MKFSKIFKRFMEKSPISVMARGLMERAFDSEKMDEWFDAHADRQYTRELLFSTVFDIMSLVVSGSYKSVHAAFQALKEDIAVSVKSIYNKLNCLEPALSEEMVRYAAGQATPLIERLGGTLEPLLQGFRVKMLDGNCIEASHHRIKELRDTASGALPGKSLVVYDPALRLPIDVFACEDGHAQERSLLKKVAETLERDDLWVADRNFCTVSFLFAIASKGFFIIRRHGNCPVEIVGELVYVGRTETGDVYAQPVVVRDESGNKMELRRIVVRLDKPTRDGDREISILTNLPNEKAQGVQVSEIYRKRWTIETAFQQLAEYFNSEINSLGYPKAALFGFCTALVAYTILSTIKAALSSEYGAETVETQVSGYYLADEIQMTCRGMLIAVEEDEWNVFRVLDTDQLVELLRQLARNVDMPKFRKHVRGPKKKKEKPKSDPKRPHVSTAKLIAERKERKK